MKQELNEQELENVVGGTVIISQDYMVISYTTIGKKKQLRNCSYRQARDYVDDLFDQNPGLSGQEFDQLCYDKMKAKGWVS